MVASGVVMLVLGFILYIIDKERNKSGDAGIFLSTLGGWVVFAGFIVALWRWMP